MTIDFDDPLPTSTPRAPAEGPAFPFGERGGAADVPAVSPASASSSASGSAPVSGQTGAAYERSGFRPPDPAGPSAPSADAAARNATERRGVEGAAAGADRREGAIRQNAGDSGAASAPVLPSLLLSALLRAVNHVLRQQAWARERLRPFAGRIVLLAVDPSSPLHRLAPPLRTRITAEGLLEAGDTVVTAPVSDQAGGGGVSGSGGGVSGSASAGGTATGRPAGAAADVSLWLRPGPAMLLDGLSGGPRGLSAHLRVDGDVMLAAVMGDLAEQLRWDAEEDASRLVGDIPARRLFAGLAVLRERFGRTRSNLERSAVQYLTVEDPQLLSGAELASHAGELAALQQRLDQLDRRLAGAAARP
ncbi:MAG TPA: hypothetical protein PKA20_22010 [Burkholderiaceae bacterium]|nr:hypothetical protein [Burkholderiaceae bacterium]